MAASEKHGGFRALRGDASNQTLGISLPEAGLNTSLALHLYKASDASVDWNVSAYSDPTLLIHCADDNAATDYIKIWHDDTDATIDCYGATALNLGIGGTNYIEMSTTALYPTTTNVMALGTSTLNFTDIYLDSGGVINFDNGDMTITHGTNALTIAGGGLGITGAVNLDNYLDLDAARADVYACDIAQTANGGGLYVNNSGTGNLVRFDDSGVQKFRINSAGNTTVEGQLSCHNGLAIDTGARNDMYIVQATQSGNGGGLFVNNTGTGNAVLIQDGGVACFTIRNNGNVYIQDTLELAGILNLDVTSSEYAADVVQAGTGGALHVNNTGSGNGVLIEDNGVEKFRISSTGSINCGGQLNVHYGLAIDTGSRADMYILNVTQAGSGGCLYVNNTGTGNLVRLDDAGVEKFSIDQHGNATFSDNVNFNADVAFGISGTGIDVTFWGDTASYKVWFDQNGDTNGAWFFGTDTKGILTQWYGDTTGYYVKFDPSGDTNGAWYFSADDYGIDVCFYGQTTGYYVTWDASANSLIYVGDLATNQSSGSHAAINVSQTVSGNVDCSGTYMMLPVFSYLNFEGHASSTAWSSTGPAAALGSWIATDNTDGVAQSKGHFCAAWFTVAMGQNFVSSSTAFTCGILLHSNTNASASMVGYNYSAIRVMTNSSCLNWITAMDIQGCDYFAKFADDASMADADGNAAAEKVPDGYIAILVGNELQYIWTYTNIA